MYSHLRKKCTFFLLFIPWLCFLCRSFKKYTFLIVYLFDCTPFLVTPVISLSREGSTCMYKDADSIKTYNKRVWKFSPGNQTFGVIVLRKSVCCSTHNTVRLSKYWKDNLLLMASHFQSRLLKWWSWTCLFSFCFYCLL